MYTYIYTCATSNMMKLVCLTMWYNYCTDKNEDFEGEHDD